MTRLNADHLPPHGLEDAHEFFRQGDDGEYGEAVPEPIEDPLLTEVGGSRDWAQVEHQLARRARNARWVTGLMVALSLATVLVFAVRSTNEDDSQGGPASAESAPRVLRPDRKERGQVRPHVASVPRIESAKNEPDSAEPELGSVAPSRVESLQTRTPTVRSSRVRGLRAQVAPPRAASTPTTNRPAQPPGPPRTAESARPYSPPTARFED